MSAAAGALASGVFVCLVPLGLVAARVLVTARARDAVALALPLAIAGLSIPLALTAALGYFHVGWNGALGWLLAIVAIAVVATRGFDAFRQDVRRALAAHPGPLLIVAFAAVVYSLGVVETPIGGRDEGLYTLAGLALDRAGTVQITAPDALARASGLFEPFVSGIPFHLPGVPAGDVLRPQFSPLLPAWIAQLHAAGGDAALYRINLLFTLAGALVFHALARRMLRPSLALLALVVFALNPAEVWIARINLAEPLGALLTLAGLLLAIEYVHAGGRRRAWVTVVVMALAALVRLDTLIVAPLLTAAALAFAIGGHDRDAARALFRLGASVLAGQSLAIAALALESPAYVLDHLRILLLAPVASATGTTLYVLVVRTFPAVAVDARSRRVLAAVLGTALVLLFAYASLARPWIEPFALIADRGSILGGTRDYREESLWNLAAYLGWPCVILALVGAWLAVRRTVQGRASAATALIAVLAVGTAVVYLAAPGVSPDHPWAIRRMVTLVIPLTILMAAYGLQSALHVAFGWRQGHVPQLAALAVAAWMLIVQRGTLNFTQNAGVTAQLRALDAALPPGPLVMRDLEALATTFALAFGRDVLPLRDEFVAVNPASQRFWSTCRARPCTLLHASFEGLDGLERAPPTPLQLSRRYVAPTVHPLAHERQRETLHFFASRIAGIAREPAPTNAGATRDWRLQDHGLYRDELVPGTAVRWTNGDAELTLPAVSADRVEVRLASAAPGAQPLRIELDGVAVFAGTLRPGTQQWQFPIDRSITGKHRLAMHGSTFVPGDSVHGRDRRSLGVSIRAIRMLDATRPVLSGTSPASDFRSQLAVHRIDHRLQDDTRPTLTLRADVDNRGTAAWPAQHETAAGSRWVALGVYWTRSGDARRLVEQRVELPYSLSPGEHWTTPIVLDLQADPLRSLTAGDYEVHIGPVLEGVAWFADHGDRMVTIPITIAAPRNAS